jgi:hypothetical protein
MTTTTDTSTTGSAPFVESARWRVDGGRPRQQAMADAVMAHRRRLPRPDGLLFLDCFLSTDGTLVWFFTGWASPEAHARHRDSPAHAELTGVTERAVPDTTHVQTITARPHGGLGMGGADAPLPGCTVLVTIDTDSPALQTTVAETIRAHVATPPPGGVGGRLYFSTDGRHVLNYAQWTSEEAHREAVGSPALGGSKGIFDGISGIEGGSMNRYQLYRRLP